MESFMSRVQEKIELNQVNTHKLVLKRKERITKGKTLDGFHPLSNFFEEGK